VIWSCSAGSRVADHPSEVTARSRLHPRHGIPVLRDFEQFGSIPASIPRQMHARRADHDSTTWNICRSRLQRMCRSGGATSHPSRRWKRACEPVVAGSFLWSSAQQKANYATFKFILKEWGFFKAATKFETVRVCAMKATMKLTFVALFAVPQPW